MAEQGPLSLFQKMQRNSEELMRRSVGNERIDAVVTNSAWLKIGKAITEAAVGQSIQPLTSAGFDLLVGLVGVEDEQAKLLQSIDRQVGLLRTGPFHTGRLYLQEAARVRPDVQRAADFLDKAIQSFYQAHSLTQAHLERGIVEFHIGLTWLLLGAAEDSKHWLAESHASLTHAAELLAQEADNITVLPNKSTVAFASYLSPVGVGVLAAKLRKVRRAERASLALARLVPVIEAASRAAAGTGTPGLPWYELEVAGEGWTLRPTLPINPTADRRQPDQPE